MSDYIPEELLVNIFSRLPVKSLFRFKSVSKRWGSIISSPDFINAHFTNSSKRPSFMLSRINHDQASCTIEHFILHSDDRSVVDYAALDYPLGRRGMRQMIVGACNGLLCLSDGENVLLWNPSIRRYFNLPSSRFTIMNSIKWCIFFGFDLKAKDYKVVRINCFFNLRDRLQMTIAEVYSLSIGRWETVSSAVPSLRFQLLSREQVNINGACICIAFDFKASSKGCSRPMLLSFDLGDEVFQLMKTPEQMSGLISGIRLYQDMVSVFEVQEMESPSTVSIWVMREFGVAESWTKQYCFDFSGRREFGDFYERPSFYDGYYVESLALLNESILNGETPPRLADIVLPTWLSKGCEGAAAKKNAILSVTSARGNLLEFLLTG